MPQTMPKPLNTEAGRANLYSSLAATHAAPRKQTAMTESGADAAFAIGFCVFFLAYLAFQVVRGLWL